MRRSRPHGDETPLRPELYRGWLPGGRYWATDGDELALLGGGGVARGRIGEALHEKASEEEDACHPQQLALCGERLALGCAGHVRLSKGQAPPLRLQLPPRGVLGFDRRGALVIAYGTPEGGAVLRSHDLDDPNAFTERPVPLSDADALTLTGGCHRAALWLSSSRSAQQIDPPRPGPAFPLPARVAPSTEKAPDDAEIVGVRADGELIVGTSQGLVFVPSGKTFSLGRAGADQVSFAEDGKHGLWRQDVGAMLQTADGGASWAPIPSPVAEHAMVVCGATRCLLGGGAFLDGFVEAPAYVPAIRAAVAVRADEPAKLRCRPDPTALPRDRGTLLALSPRLGTDLFAGLAGDPEMAPGSRRWAVFGARDRGLLTQPLPRLASRYEAERGGLSEPSGTAGAIAVGRVDGGDDRRDRWTYLTTAKAAVGTTQLPLQAASWLSLDEVAEPTYPGRLIVWGKHAPEALPFRVPVRRPCPGVFGREPSGALLAAEICEGSLVVFARGLDGVQIDHGVVVRSGVAREDGVGLTLAGDAAGRGVFVLETTADGRPEIRFHALSDSLALGPGVPVPGTRGQPDALVDLPSCPPEPTGAPMRLLARKPVRFTTGRPDVLTRGLVQRIARLTLSGGCVERTFVTDRPDLDAALVVAGNGGLAAEPSATIGLRCDPLDPSPE